MTRIEIDPNVRVHGNDTRAGLEDVEGSLAVGLVVEVYESESGLVGTGCVTEIDSTKGLVYLSVDWSSLRVPPISEPPRDEFAELWASIQRLTPEQEARLRHEAETAEIVFAAFRLAHECRDAGDITSAILCLEIAAEGGVIGAARELLELRSAEAIWRELDHD